MNSLRRWLYRPKRSDPSLLAQFYFADEELNLIAAELDGFEGRKDPERCAALVNQLRACQARVLNIVSQMMDESIKDQRAFRDFRVKFPDDVIQENLAGQLWFGAECLAAGSSIMNREVESACMRPLARALTKNLDSLRTILRGQCLHSVDEYTDLIRENLIIFDKLFAEFELSYVSAMVSVKTAHEYDMIQEITVLFSETVQRALSVGLLTQEMIDEYDPALMFTIPRLAIICGVLIFKDGPLNPDNDPWNISEMFRPFQTLLLKIRELLGILTPEELCTLERALCSQDEPSFLLSLEEKRKQAREERRKHKKERKDSGKAKNNKKPSDGDTGSVDSELTAREIAERLEALALNFEASHNNPEVADDSNNSTSQAVCDSNAKGEDLPSSSLAQNGDVTPGNVHNSTSTQGLVGDLGCVEDLYREANLDSSDMISVPASAYPGHDLLIQGIQMPSQFMNGGEHGQTDVDVHSLSSLNHPNIDNDESSYSLNENSENHDEVLNTRDRFSLNKCDSKDSGLQSEIVSNSGSMFTISSSDSNQQILSSDSIPTPSDQNCTDSNSEDAESNDLAMDGDGNSSKAHLENSSDSSATIVSVMPTETTTIEGINGLRPGNEVERTRNETLPSDKASITQDLKDIETARVDYYDDNIQKDGSEHSISDDTSVTEAEIEIPKTDVEIEVSATLSNTSDNIYTANSDISCIQDANCSSVDAESVVDSAQTLSSVHMPKTSARTDLDENSNHSHDASCDKIEPKVASESEYLHGTKVVNGDSDCLSCDTLKDFHSRDEVDIHSDSLINENSICITIENSATDNSTVSDGQSENKESIMNCDSSKGAVSLKEEDGDPAQQGPTSNLSFSPNTCVIVDDTSVGPNLTSDVSSSTDHDVVKTESGCSSSTQLKETSQSLEAAPKALPSSGAKGGRSDHHKGVLNVKTKASSKRRSKNPERRARRQEAGSCRSRDSKPVLCPHHAKMILEAHQQLDNEHYNSSDTSSYTSECGDQEEIALAIEAAESATRNHVRARFKSSSDMIHRLFVCISGVADQLQTNFAGDLRNILRCVFDMNCPEPMDSCDNEKPKDTTPLGAAYRAMSHSSRTPRHRHSSLRRDPPTWVPDEQSDDCMACQVPFNFLRRRHHCRNCGKIFCSRCSSNFVPLPHFGQEKAVRVCNRCFMFQVTPFTTE